MRGGTRCRLLLAAIVGTATNHIINVHRRDESRAITAVHHANDVDIFYRRLDLHPDTCCGMCTQIELNQVVLDLLVATGSEDGGRLNPVVLTAAGMSGVTIVVRLTLVYRNNAVGADPTARETHVFSVDVKPEDWNATPCSYIKTDCVVFQNGEIIMFAPDAPGDFAVLSLEAVDKFMVDSNVIVISTTSDIRCKDTDSCDPIETAADLNPNSSGTSFGVPTQSRFNDGFCNPSIFNNPHITGLRGQRYTWSGENGGWYAFLSTPDQLQMNLRVTSHLPTTFPERQLVTGVALGTKDGHKIVAEITDPLNLTRTCEDSIDTASAGPSATPCLANGALRVTVDGREEMTGAGESHFEGGIHITAVNLPLECQRFGDYHMWEDLPEEDKLVHAGHRKLRASRVVTSFSHWLLTDSVMIAPPWCVKYLNELDGDVAALAALRSDHAILRVESPNLSVRVNVGINSEQEQTLQDGRVVPAASFWQMDVRVEDAEGIEMAKGMLGETARPVRDEQTGNRVMTGLGVLRGEVEDYRVVHPLGTEFKQLFVAEE